MYMRTRAIGLYYAFIILTRGNNVDKICPIISSVTIKQNAYGGNVDEMSWQECEKENCQWWWKCRDKKAEKTKRESLENEARCDDFDAIPF